MWTRLQQFLAINCCQNIGRGLDTRRNSSRTSCVWRETGSLTGSRLLLCMNQLGRALITVNRDIAWSRLHTAMQSYEQTCIHVDGSLSINELWHATLLQTSTPGGGRGGGERIEERREERTGKERGGEVGWAGLGIEVVCAQMMWPSCCTPTTSHSAASLRTQPPRCTFFAQKIKTGPAAVCASCAKEHPTNSIFKSNAWDHYISLMSLRSDA